MAKKRITARQQAFINEYVRTRNASAAARKAGYEQVTAGQIAWNLLNKPNYQHVQDEVKRLLDDQEEQEKLQHEAMTNLLMQTITRDERELKSEAGEWRSLEELSPEMAGQVATVQESEYENEGGQRGKTVSYKLTNKLEAVKILGKHNGYFATGNASGEDSAYCRAEEDLADIFARVRRRSASPIPGTTDADTEKSS